MTNKQRFKGLCLLYEAGVKNFTIINNAVNRFHPIIISAIVPVLLSCKDEED